VEFVGETRIKMRNSHSGEPVSRQESRPEPDEEYGRSKLPDGALEERYIAPRRGQPSVRYFADSLDCQVN
jgi:hypothetical protein